MLRFSLHSMPRLSAASLPALALVGIIGGCTSMSSPHAANSPTGMRVTSSAFSDSSRIPSEHAGVGDCGGNNISLPVSWTNVPSRAKSIAVVFSDPDGAGGLGVSHWVAYNIDVERGQLKSGEAQTGASFMMGPNVAGAAAYRGMCPPVGDFAHHYTLTVIASDLAPNVLPAGLGRDALLAALKGHAVAGQSVVGLYSR